MIKDVVERYIGLVINNNNQVCYPFECKITLGKSAICHTNIKMQLIAGLDIKTVSVVQFMPQPAPQVTPFHQKFQHAC